MFRGCAAASIYRRRTTAHVLRFDSLATLCVGMVTNTRHAQRRHGSTLSRRHTWENGGHTYATPGDRKKMHTFFWPSFEER